MTQDISGSTCPFCEQSNQCAATSEKGCWCSKIKVPSELVELVPIKLKKKACICSGCVAQFHHDREAFLNKQSVSCNVL